MTTDWIVYRRKYKYRLFDDYITQLPFKVSIDIITPFVTLSRSGALIIKEGYSWDGPSGPTFDTDNFMRGSLVHDALYELMRANLLNHEIYRIKIDTVLFQMCLEDGMNWLRAWWVYRGVRWGGHAVADPQYVKPLLRSPNKKWQLSNQYR